MNRSFIKTFLLLWRLSRQVIDLQNSVRDITTRLDLIMKRLHSLNEMKEREALKQLATTKNVCMETKWLTMILILIVIKRFFSFYFGFENFLFFFIKLTLSASIQGAESAFDGSVLVDVDRRMKAEVPSRNSVHTYSSHGPRMWITSEKQQASQNQILRKFADTWQWLFDASQNLKQSMSFYEKGLQVIIEIFRYNDKVN